MPGFEENWFDWHLMIDGTIYSILLLISFNFCSIFLILLGLHCVKIVKLAKDTIVFGIAGTIGFFWVTRHTMTTRHSVARHSVARHSVARHLVALGTRLPWHSCARSHHQAEFSIISTLSSLPAGHPTSFQNNLNGSQPRQKTNRMQ